LLSRFPYFACTDWEAKGYAEKMEGDAQRDEYSDKDAGKEKFGPLAEKWIRLRDVGGLSRERYERIYANQVEGTFAHRAVRGVKASEILEWLRSPEIARLSGTTRSAAYLIVAGTFDLAVEDKLRRDNPARSKIIPVPRQEDSERELWPVEQVWKVIDACPEEYRIIPVMEAGMGLRQGCAFGIAEDDFDFEAGKATVARQIVRVKGRYYFKLPKGGKARTVPVSAGVQQHVQRHIAKFPPRGVHAPVAQRGRHRGRSGDGEAARGLARRRPAHQRAARAANDLRRQGVEARAARGGDRPRAPAGQAEGAGLLKRRARQRPARAAALLLHRAPGRRRAPGGGHGLHGPLAQGAPGDVPRVRSRHRGDLRAGPRGGRFEAFRLRPVASAGTVTELRRAQ
jgi:integrase